MTMGDRVYWMRIVARRGGNKQAANAPQRMSNRNHPAKSKPDADL
jgi:hypothetical protein